MTILASARKLPETRRQGERLARQCCDEKWAPANGAADASGESIFKQATVAWLGGCALTDVIARVRRG
jgi:hypothetical protein